MILVYIIGIPLAILLIISIATKKYRNPWKLYMIFGKKGSGKSTYLVKTAIRYIKKGYIVYTNIPDLVIQNVRLIDVDHLGDFVPVSHSVMLLDECGMIWDNRDYKKFKPSVRDFFKLQRHYKVIVYLASQTFDIDKKLRDLTDGMYLHKCILNVLSIGKRIYKSITLTESTSEAESRIAENLKFAPIWNWSFTWIPKYNKYFSSFNLPDKPEIQYQELSGFDVSQLKRARENLSKSVSA